MDAPIVWNVNCDWLVVAVQPNEALQIVARVDTKERAMLFADCLRDSGERALAVHGPEDQE